MKKYFIIMVCIIALFTAGCSAGAPAASDPPAPEPAEQGYAPAPPEILSGLINDEYDGLVFTVEVLERNAILPGMSFTATVLVENTGDKTLNYIQGSGSYETPEAVFLFSNTLQTVYPKDQLGLATMDFVAKELKPGESLLFKLPVMAIQPNPDFDLYTFELFNDTVFIADVDWTELQDRFPDLVAAAPGSYTVIAYFLYNISEEFDGGMTNIFDGPTGYAEASCTVTIS